MKHAQQSLGTPESGGRGALITGGIAALLASACCLGPLLLVAVGVSGAWIGNLILLEPYRPIFIGIALAAMLFAYHRIFAPMESCQPQKLCARPQTRRGYKILFGIVVALIVVALAFPYVLPFFY